MKTALYVIALSALCFSQSTAAKSCQKEDAAAKSVSISFVGSDANRQSEGKQAGKFILRNDSKLKITLPIYKGEPPELHPAAAVLQREDSEGKWWDKHDTLEDYFPANGTAQVVSGQVLTFYSLTSNEKDRRYRLGVRTMKGCWLYSEPFTFKD